MNKRILVTGAEGFIGKYLLDELGNRGVEYLATDVISEEIVQKENYRKVSLLHKEEIRKVVRDYQPDVVVHLAAIALVTHENIPEIYEVNVCGTENLLSVLAEEQKNKTRVVLMSTAGVYGNQDAEFYDESLPYKPSNHYSFSKMITEYLSKEYEESLDIKIVRPFNIIGTGQKETFLIPKLVKYFAERVDRIPLGNISSIRDYISVDGGMTDNIRSSLYNAKYDAVIANKAGQEANHLVTVAGKNCESGDILIRDIMLQDPQPGDILAMFSTGAYHYSMSSNYNQLPKPAVVFTYQGKSKEVIRRQTFDDLVAYDVD